MQVIAHMSLERQLISHCVANYLCYTPLGHSIIIQWNHHARGKADDVIEVDVTDTSQWHPSLSYKEGFLLQRNLLFHTQSFGSSIFKHIDFPVASFIWSSLDHDKSYGTDLSKHKWRFSHSLELSINKHRLPGTKPDEYIWMD